MDETTRLYRIYKTCLEMLHDRKYVVLEVRGRPSSATATPPPTLACSAADAPPTGVFVPSALCAPLLEVVLMVASPSAAQDELTMTKDGFREKFGDEPRKDDVTILSSRQEDPTDQVRSPLCTMFLTLVQRRPDPFTSTHACKSAVGHAAQ